MFYLQRTLLCAIVLVFFISETRAEEDGLAAWEKIWGYLKESGGEYLQDKAERFYPKPVERDDNDPAVTWEFPNPLDSLSQSSEEKTNPFFPNDNKDRTKKNRSNKSDDKLYVRDGNMKRLCPYKTKYECEEFEKELNNNDDKEITKKSFSECKKITKKIMQSGDYFVFNKKGFKDKCGHYKLENLRSDRPQRRYQRPQNTFVDCNQLQARYQRFAMSGGTSNLQALSNMYQQLVRHCGAPPAQMGGPRW